MLKLAVELRFFFFFRSQETGETGLLAHYNFNQEHLHVLGIIQAWLMTCSALKMLHGAIHASKKFKMSVSSSFFLFFHSTPLCGNFLCRTCPSLIHTKAGIIK